MLHRSKIEHSMGCSLTWKGEESHVDAESRPLCFEISWRNLYHRRDYTGVYDGYMVGMFTCVASPVTAGDQFKVPATRGPPGKVAPLASGMKSSRQRQPFARRSTHAQREEGIQRSLKIRTGELVKNSLIPELLLVTVCYSMLQ